MTFFLSRIAIVTTRWASPKLFLISQALSYFNIPLWVFRVWKYPKKCLEDLTTFFMSTWWEDSKTMKEIEFSQWLFELPAKYHSQFIPSGSTFLSCLSLPSKSHHENSISSTCLESPHQVDKKNVVKSSNHFFGYFNTHSDTLKLWTGARLFFWPLFKSITVISRLEIFYLLKKF